MECEKDSLITFLFHTVGRLNRIVGYYTFKHEKTMFADVFEARGDSHVKRTGLLVAPFRD